MSFESFALSPDILRAIVEEGYTEPTPIQAQAIPVVLGGGDVMGAAQTGTGKTASFTLPILELLRPHMSSSPSPARHPVRALVLLPTRELALQVSEAVATYGKHLQLRSTCVFGGVDIKPQLAEVRAGVEILIATPGRLLDHVEQKSVNLGQVQILVLDEADRMLDMGFMPDIKRIINLLPKKRQNLLFSATFSDEIKKLAGGILSNPQVIEVARRNATADTVTQTAYAVSSDEKRALLKHLVETKNIAQAIVFSNTKLGTARLARHLEREGLKADAIHGDKSQQERLAALNKFKAGEITLLIATDVAARGLDIDEMPCVINYELPHSPEDYVHRIGRTGRAGKEGMAISFFAPEEERYLVDIEKLTKRKIERAVEHGFEPGASEPHFSAGGRERRHGKFDRDTTSRHTRKQAEKIDPWFLKPYEPSTPAPVAPVVPASASPATATPTPRTGTAKKAGVGALLGGLKKS
jgi:ATP-dependent RNA helicase RhlE